MVQQSKLSNTSSAEWNSKDLEMVITKMAVLATELTRKEKKNSNSNLATTEQCGENRECKILAFNKKNVLFKDDCRIPKRKMTVAHEVDVQSVPKKFRSCGILITFYLSQQTQFIKTQGKP